MFSSYSLDRNVEKMFDLWTEIFSRSVQVSAITLTCNVPVIGIHLTFVVSHQPWVKNIKVDPAVNYARAP